MRVKCIKDYDTVDKLKGLTLDTYYQLTDIDNIGYRIIDDLGRNFWYTKECFEPIEEARDNILNKLLNELLNDIF
jgi:hypothetical protein